MSVWNFKTGPNKNMDVLDLNAISKGDCWALTEETTIALSNLAAPNFTLVP